MSFIDGSAVNVALPVMQRELHASAQSGQWVVESYALFLSALMLIGGSLGDIFGRRLVYGIGIALFAVASLGCALAPNVDVLVVARSVQGIGAALATPGSLALISAHFEGEARGKAIGTWSGFAAMTAAIGPVLGGWLVQFGSWRTVFLINVPLALIVIVLLVRAVDESRDESAPREVDYPGALLATLGLGGLVYGLIALQSGQHDQAALWALGIGSIALAGFIAVERRSRHPMMRLDVFTSRTFSAANLYTFLLYSAIGGCLYFVPFDLIDVQGYGTAAAGGAMLPFIVIMAVSSRFSGGLVARIGARRPLVAGAVLAAAGLAVYGCAGIGKPYWTSFFPGAVLLGLGGALFVAPLTTTVMDALESSHAGLASGINNAVSRVAGLIAVAALGIVLANVFDARIATRIAHLPLAPSVRRLALAARGPLFAGQVPHGVVGPSDRAQIAAAAKASYADGFALVMFVSAFITLGAAAIGSDRSFALRPNLTDKRFS